MKTVLPTGKYTLGPTLRAFEEKFAAYRAVKYCLGISNGTEALHLALVPLGIGPGDEVITVANTYVAAAFAVSYVGATPVCVDIDLSPIRWIYRGDVWTVDLLSSCRGGH